MEKKALVPSGGILIILCFFLPWGRACQTNITGLGLATDKDVGSPIFWLIPIIGLAVTLFYFAIRERSRLIALGGAIIGLAVLLVKALVPLARGDWEGIGLSVQAGGYGTILGLILMLVGGIIEGRTADSEESRERADPEENKADAAKPPDSGPAPPPISYVDRARAKGLVNQAVALADRGDEPSQTQARRIWEEILEMGGLEAHDTLKAHYYLGSDFLSHHDLARGIMHLEKVLSADPSLEFLTHVDRSSKAILRAEMSVSMSVAFQSLARDIANAEDQGVEKAIAFLEAKLGILRNLAAPSFFLELADLHRRVGNEARSGRLLLAAVDAPVHGSCSQMESKEAAQELVRSLSISRAGSKSEGLWPESGGAGLEDGDDQQISLLRRIVIVVVILFITAAIFIIALPGPYRKHMKQAQDLFAAGRYYEALAEVAEAKEKKETQEANALHRSIQEKIAEQKERERQATLRREHADYLGRAQNAYNSGDYREARRYVQLARERMSSRQADMLIGQIDGQLRRLREQEEQRRQEEARRQLAAADDAAFRWARNSGTEAGYLQYIQAYPNGRHTYEAQNALRVIRVNADDEAFRRAQSGNTESAYREYLQAYPNGRHANSARSGINRAQQQAAREKAAIVPALQEFVHVPSYSGTRRMGEVMIQFQDGYRMLVRDSIRGQTRGVAYYEGKRVDRINGVSHTYYHILNTDLQKII